MTPEKKELERLLNAFSVEPVHDSETLRRYLDSHPEFAEDLLDLAHELQFTEALSSIETEAIPDASAEQAWNAFVSFQAPAKSEADAAAFGDQLRGQAFVNLSQAMELPRAFLIAFRDRLVVPSSIPDSFLSAIAKATGSTIELVRAYLSLPPQVAGAAQFKSEDKPQQQGQVSFRELVQSTAMPEEKRSALLKDTQDDGPQ